MELKLVEYNDIRKEYDERLKLQRSDIHQLRNENIQLLKEKEDFFKENQELKENCLNIKGNRNQSFYWIIFETFFGVISITRFSKSLYSVYMCIAICLFYYKLDLASGVYK